MARRKRKVNMTQAVKDYLADNPDHAPKEVATALGEQGISIKPQYVSAIKSKLAQAAQAEDIPALDAPAPRRRRSRGRPSRRAAATNSAPAVDYKNLLEAKSFVHSIGGINEARKVLDAYAKLQ